MSQFTLSTMRAPHLSPNGGLKFFNLTASLSRAIGYRRVRLLVADLDTLDAFEGLATLAGLEDGLSANDLRSKLQDIGEDHLTSVLSSNRELTRWAPDGATYFYVSGGMNSGDNPTDAADSIDFLDALAVFNQSIGYEELQRAVRAE